MLTITCLLALAAFVLTLASAGWGRVPIWVPVLVLSLAALFSCIPLR